MKLKSGMSVLLAQNPKALEIARKKYFKACNISLDMNQTQKLRTQMSEPHFDDHFDDDQKRKLKQYFDYDDRKMVEDIA